VESYGEALRRLRQARGMSQRALARAVGLNPTLINRSEAGDRPPQGPAEVAAIAQALRLTPAEHDLLLARAGYWPAVFLAVGPSDPTLRAVAEALASPTLPAEVRSALRTAIESAVRAATLGREPAGARPPAVE
jgi:transcriptional regulator with XRE-family HTH domain